MGGRAERAAAVDRPIGPPPVDWKAGPASTPVRHPAPALVAEPATNRRCRADEPRMRAPGESARTDPLAHWP